MDRPRSADPLHLGAVQRAQELGLEVERHLADLVEEERALVGLLEGPLAQPLGAGEGPLLVAEELALHEGLRDGRAVHRDERAVAARGERAWSARATSSLPVPVSPRMVTAVSAGASRSMRSKTCRIPGSSENIPS